MWFYNEWIVAGQKKILFPQQTNTYKQNYIYRFKFLISADKKVSTAFGNLFKVKDWLTDWQVVLWWKQTINECLNKEKKKKIEVKKTVIWVQNKKKSLVLKQE